MTCPTCGTLSLNNSAKKNEIEKCSNVQNDTAVRILVCHTWYSHGTGNPCRYTGTNTQYLVLGTGVLMNCRAVARAQHLGQNSRFAQQPPQGSATRDFWRATFFAAGVFFLARRFSPEARKKIEVLFF